jgi:hypothetical protein
MKDETLYIYLVFSKTGTWLSRALKYFSPSKFVHTSIAFDDTFTEMYSFGRINPNNPINGGFVKESLYDGVYKKFESSECRIIRVSVTSEQYEGLKSDIEYFYTNRHKYKYNFLGLFGVFFKLPIQRKYHYFCSQFVYTLLKKHNLLDLKKEPELVHTVDLFNIENNSLIYEGLILDMPYREPLILKNIS